MYEISGTVVRDGTCTKIVAGVVAGNKMAALERLLNRIQGDLINISIVRSQVESGEFLMEAV